MKLLSLLAGLALVALAANAQTTAPKKPATKDAPKAAPTKSTPAKTPPAKTTPAPGKDSKPTPPAKEADKPKPGSTPPAKPEAAPSPKPAPAPPPPPPPDAVKPEDDDAFKQLQFLTATMQIIRENYVDEHKVTYAELVAGALEGMVRRLDPHCAYISAQAFEDLQKEQSDTSEGVGLTIALRNGKLTVVTLREDGSAAKAGMLAGDQIQRINDAYMDKAGVVEAMQLLKGKAGDTVRLTVLRPGTGQFLDFKLLREVLQETSVQDGMLLHEKMASPWRIGYIRLLEFTGATGRDMAVALDKLEAEGLQALVLDLRNNGGGLVDTAVEVCGEFLPEGTVVVTQEGRKAAQDSPPWRTPKRKGKAAGPRSYPLVVLVNEGSASAAEIVAGVMQDLRRAVIVGTTSFGKGSVQTVQALPNGAALSLTTAKYYTPGHRTIHEHGITPNIICELTPLEEVKIRNWRISHEQGGAAALSLAELGDRQLERAVDTLKGVLVFQDFNKPVATPKPPVSPSNAPAKLDALMAPPKLPARGEDPVAPPVKK